MAPDPMSVDASAIDRNLRAIRQVQSGWRLPELPDEVMLDLAGQPMDHRGISDFLSGLERDAFNENPEDFTAPATPQLSVVSNMGEYGPLAVDGFTRAMSTINSLRGMSPAEVLDADATQRWKLRAIDQGFLTAPEDGVVDSSWSPELGAIQRQMQYAEFNDKMRGDRPGAMPFGRAMGILADWTSPSGLMRAAVDLDLFWDTGQIGREIDSWGDKWRKVGDSKNPLDFGKNLFDALTGPIDDIVVPALNMALLFTGVGHATNFARLAITGTSAVKAAETVTFMNRLYELPKVGTLIGKIFPAADAAGLAKASWTAEKFMGSSKPLLQAAGTRMAAWRELPTVIGTRGIVQQGMRLGIASQVENRLLPNYQGSGSLSDIPAVASLSERALGNAWVTGIGEVLFTPYTIFEPGTFINGGKSAVAGAFKYLGTTQGRMAAGAVIGAGVASVGDADGGDVLQGAAIGAGAAAAAPTVGRWMRDGMEVLEFGGHKVPLLSKAVKGVGKSLAHLNWEPIGNDQRMSQVFMDAMRAKLEPEAWAGFEQGIVKQGFLKTLANHVGTDTKGASAMMAYVAVSASIDRTAALQAGAAGSKGWYERYWLARNKLTAQLRTFDDTATREDVVWAIVSKSGGRRDIKKRFDRYMAQVEATPETFAEHLSNHNMSAQQTLRQLLQPDNLPVTALDDHYAGLTKYVANAMDSFGNWPKYQPLTESLGAHLNAGLFEEAMLAPAVSMLGTRAPIKVLEALPEYVPPMDESMVANWSSHLNDSLFLEQGVDVESWRRAGGYYNPLAAEIDPMRHKVTLMRAETPSKAEYLVAADELERTLKVTQAHLRAAKVTRKDGEAVIRIMDELDLSGLSAHQLSQTLKAAAVGEKDRQAFESVRQFVQHMKAQGVDTGRQFDLALNDFVNSLTQDARWTRYGQKTHLVDENQKILGGMDALKARAKQLRQDARYVAAEIDTDDLLEKIALKHGTKVDTTEPPELDAAMPGSYFHGSSSQVPEFTEFGARGAENLFGPGVYTTDTPGVAATYMKKGSGQSPNVQRLEWTGTGQPRIVSMDAPQPEVRSALQKQFDALDEASWFDPDVDEWDAVRSALASSTATAADQYTAIRKAVASARLPKSEADEIFYAINDDLQGSGIDALTHKGGVRTGNREHAATIWLKQDSVRVAEDVTSRTAARVTSTVKPNYEAEAYKDLKAYFEHASSQGYKVVYGADFLMPDELLNRTGMFADINERHMNAMTLGNFFGRRHPEELALNVQMARQRSIARQLGKIHGDVAPDDERVLTALDDVYHHVLDPELQRNSAMISDLRHQSMTERWGTALRTSKQPQSMQDLGLGASRKRVVDKLVQMGWSEKEAGAVWQGLKEARYAEWRDMGLYAIEAKLRGRNQLLDALHVLGGTPNAKVLRTAAGGAAMGAAYGVATGEDMEGILTDAAVGAIGRPLAGQITKRAEQAMDLTAWARYGYMADNLAALRDRLRFSLSPFFDLSRYTEAWMLGQTAAPRRAADGSRIALPLNQSPRALRKSLLAEGGEAFAEGKMRQISDEFMAASRGHFDPGELESTAKWFQSTGLLGFNPTAWMQSTFHHMRQAGLSPDEAYKNVREMYTYGTKARSAFEQSVNFVFFPFSFQKKSLGHLANFISDDLTRSVLIHDAYKAYEALDERYDLGAWAEDHLPVLKKLQQLNMFAFGISPGRLGGINAQAIEAFVGDPTSMDPEKRGLILNLFSPQGVNMASVGTEEFKKLVMKTVPIMNDVKWMINDLKSQGHVLFDPSHMTVAAQTREAYNEWNEYRKGVDAALKNVGASWYDLKNNPGLAPLWEDMQRHKTELEKRYPGWNESKLRGATNRADLAMEKEHRLNMVQFFPEEATLADYQFAQMEQTLDALKAIMGQYGITDWEDAPPSEYARVKGVAIEFVRANRAFLMVWRKHYASTFGDITSDVEV